MSSEAQFRQQMIALLVEDRLSLEIFCKMANKFGVGVIRPGHMSTCDFRAHKADRFYPKVENNIVIGGNFG